MKPITQEAREMISLRMKGQSKPKVTCPYCNKIGGISPMLRFHFENCKLKENNIVRSI